MSSNDASAASSGGLGAEPTVAAPPQKKKTRKFNSGPRVRGKKGALGAFCSIPLDLLAEICRNSDHKTLYSLSLPNKAFRATLESAAAKPIWNGARKEAGLPALKAGELSDLQYAELVWGKGCQFCEAKVSKTDFRLRIRYCNICEVEYLVAGPGFSLEARKCATYSYGRADSQGLRQPIYLLPEIENNSEILSRDFPSLTTPGAQAFIASRSILVSKRVNDGMLLEKWMEKQLQLKISDREAVRQARKDEIERRLLLEGWAQNDFDIQWGAHKLVKEPKAITDRIWKNLQPKLVTYLTDRRSARAPVELANRQIARRTSLIPFYDTLIASKSPNELKFLPPLYAILSFDAFQPFWIPDNAHPIDRASWDVALAASIGEFAECTRILKESFYNSAVEAHAITSKPILAPATAGAPTDAEMDTALALPSAIFCCTSTRCPQRMWAKHWQRINPGCAHAAHFPAILEHGTGANSFVGAATLSSTTASWIEFIEGSLR